MFTTSPNKSADAVRLGAHEVVNSKNDAEMLKHAGTFNFILDTVPAKHNINAYINLLKRDGTLGFVGAPTERCHLKCLACYLGGRVFRAR